MPESDMYARMSAAMGVAFGAEDSSAVTAAIDELSLGLGALGADEGVRRALLFNLASASMRLYGMTDELDDLDAGIERAEEFLESFAGDPERTRVVTKLGFAYASRFRRTKDEDDRDSMIELCEEALTWPDPEADRRAAMLLELEHGYADRFSRDGDVEDLDTAIGYGEQALAVATPDGYSLYFRLGYLYHRRYVAKCDPADADATIRLAERALNACGPTEPARADVLALIADGYRHRFDCIGNPRDLDVAIERREQAIALTPDSDPQRARHLTDRGQDYDVLFRLTNQTDTLQASIERSEEALARMPPGNPERRSARSNLAHALHDRYALTGEVADLDTSIALCEQNVAAEPAGQALSVALNQLASCHFDRYVRTGSLHELDVSVEMHEWALPHCRPGGDHSACLSNLALCHRRRYEHFGANADLQAALSLGEQALAELDDGHPQRSNRQLNLALAYRARFNRHGNVMDLNMAIDLTEQSLAGVVVKADDRVLAMGNLSDYYRERFPFSGNPRDLERSVELAEQAVAATPVNSPRRVEFESALAGACLALYGNSGRDSDLDDAVRYIERALAATPPDEPRYLEILQNVVQVHRIWAEHRPLPDEVVPRLVNAASTSGPAAPQVRMRVCGNIGQLALRAGRLDHAAAMLRHAVEVLPQCAPRALDWSDQEHQAIGGRGLIADALAVQLAVGNVAAAVELAELGRGIVLSNQLDTRSDITSLRDIGPELADEFEQLRAELDAPRPEGAGIAEMSTWLVRRREATVQWDQLLTRIRHMPRMEDFLAPPRITDLQKAADKGTVVLVNTSELGSDALLLQTDSVTRLPLNDLRSDDVQAYADALVGVHFVESAVVPTSKQRATPELLTWLWRTVVEPVLDALGHLRPRKENEPLPRLWWVPTGALSLLPLHAAGLPDGPSALDHVVCSYAPTIRTLLHGKRQHPAEQHRQLTVAMPYTPGLADLPGCEAEARSVQARYPGTVGLANEDARVDAVQAALRNATFAHFSCHGSSHPVWPSKSALHLYDGALPVPEISKLRLREGELAYLSACSTAQGSITHADEAMHLASAFQLAGYRHVVASLWPLQDAVAARAAHRFYGLIGDPPTAELAPLALHQVVQELRAAHPRSPHVWASLVHSGP